MMLAQKKYAEALQSFNTALTYKPGDVGATNGKRQAEAGLRPAPKPPMPPMPPMPAAGGIAEFNKQFANGQAMERAGRYPAAVGAYQAALNAVAADRTRSREQYQAYGGIGRCEHAQRHFAEAVRAYDEALRRVPGDAAIKAALARARMNK
jgi:tetratricopeptide (TPR) repeat protein